MKKIKENAKENEAKEMNISEYSEIPESNVMLGNKYEEK